MSEINDGGPAFPVLDHKIGYHADIRQKEAGISVRDYFAAKAMQGLIASNDPGAGDRIEEIPEYAYLIADAMLAARSKS